MTSRWTILALCCILSFAQDFFYDQPSPLIQRLIGTAGECRNNTDPSCLYLDLTQYSFFFSSYSWAVGASAVVAGLAVDRYGTKVPLNVSAFFFVLGGLLFVVGSYVTTTEGAFGVMLAGRILNGVGTAGFVTISNRIKSSWFQYKELSLAFAVDIVAGRLGSSLSFLIMGAIVNYVGLSGCLWIAFVIVLIAGFCAVYLALTEHQSAPPTEAIVKKTWREVLSFFLHLSMFFVVFALVVGLLYGVASTFTANAAGMLAQVHGYTESQASYIAGIVYYICLLGPLVGIALDRFGYRDYWISAASVIFVFAFLIYFIPTTPGWLLCAFIGLSYAIFPPAVWSALSLIVKPETVGLSNGIVKFSQYFGSGFILTGAGIILDGNSQEGPSRFRSFILYLIVLSLVATFLSIWMNWLNEKEGKPLTPSQQERNLRFTGGEPSDAGSTTNLVQSTLKPILKLPPMEFAVFRDSSGLPSTSNNNNNNSSSNGLSRNYSRKYGI